MTSGRMARIDDELKREIEKLRERYERLGVDISFVQASRIYVREKKKKALKKENIEFPEF